MDHGLELGAGTEPELAPFLEPTLGDLVGLTTEVLVDDRGFVSAGSFDPTTDQEVNDLLGDVVNQSNPLPEEAVGVGAMWESDTIINDLGVPVITRTTTTLREFTDSGVILDVTINQFIEEPGAEADFGGVIGAIDVWDVTGGGEIELAFDRFTPVAATIDVEGEQLFRFLGQGQLQQRVSTMTTITTG